jgi:hypothetical protein
LGEVLTLGKAERAPNSGNQQNNNNDDADEDHDLFLEIRSAKQEKDLITSS